MRPISLMMFCSALFPWVAAAHDPVDLVKSAIRARRSLSVKAQDSERSMGAQRIFQTYVQTLSENYLLTIEIYALSGDDKAAAIDSLRKIVIDK
jgi:hypothetical protein